MLSPRLSVNIVEPSFLLMDDDDSEQEVEMGGFLEAEFPALKKRHTGMPSLSTRLTRMVYAICLESFCSNYFATALPHLLQIRVRLDATLTNVGQSLSRRKLNGHKKWNARRLK